MMHGVSLSVEGGGGGGLILNLLVKCRKYVTVLWLALCHDEVYVHLPSRTCIITSCWFTCVSIAHSIKPRVVRIYLKPSSERQSLMATIAVSPLLTLLN